MSPLKAKAVVICNKGDYQVIQVSNSCWTCAIHPSFANDPACQNFNQKFSISKLQHPTLACQKMKKKERSLTYLSRYIKFCWMHFETLAQSTWNDNTQDFLWPLEVLWSSRKQWSKAKCSIFQSIQVQTGLLKLDCRKQAHTHTHFLHFALNTGTLHAT
jgi:hypothetical protein